MAPDLHRPGVTVPSPAHEEDTRHAARSGALQVLTIVAQAVIAATQVVFARLYGQAIYGAYITTYAWIEAMSRGGGAGADKAMLRYVAGARASGDEEGVRRALGTGLRLCMAVAGSLSLLVLVAAPWLAALWKRPELGPAFRAFAPLPLLFGCLWILIQATLAARVTRANFWVRGVFEPVALLLAGVLAWTLGAGLRGLCLAHSMAATATLGVAIVVVYRVFRPGERHRVLSAPRVPGFARFSAFVGLSEFLNAALQRADIIMVNGFLGDKAAAIYGASELITRVVANIRYAFDSIVAGMMAEALQRNERDRLQHSLRLTTRWVVTVAAPLSMGVIALREDLLVKLYDAPYAAGASAVTVLALAHLANACLGLTGWALVAGGRSHLVAINNAMGLVFNVVTGVILTPRYGLAGTAVGVLGAVLVVQGGAVIEVARWQRVHAFTPALLKPLSAAAVSLAVELLVHAALPAGWPRMAAVIAAGLAAYVALLVAMGLPPEERRLFDRLAARLR
jgi:O-antigen/teichoic acid export membrane protein